MAAPTVEEIQGAVETDNSVTLAEIAGGTNQWYLVWAVVRRHSTGGQVSGGGLTWSTALIDGARAQIDSIISVAFGSPAAFQATIAVDAANTLGAGIIRINGSDAAGLGTLATANTSGQPATVSSGGTDNNAATLGVTSTVPNSLCITCTSMRGQTISSADPDYTQVGTYNGGTEAVRFYIHRRTLASATTDTCAHGLSGNVDWSMGGIVFAPADEGGGGEDPEFQPAWARGANAVLTARR